MFKKILYILILILCISSLSYADGAKKNQLDLSLGFGLQNTSADEVVYEGSYRASLLKWNSKNTKLLNLRLGYHITEKLQINFATSFNVGGNYDSDSKMDDYDWDELYGDDSFDNWSDHSWHSDVKFKTYSFDLNIKPIFYSNKNFNLYGLLGYKFETYHWVAFGGSYIHSTGDSDDGNDEAEASIEDFRKYRGNIPDKQLGIGYRQTIHTPYVGLSLKYIYNSIDADILLKFSPFSTRILKDNHYVNGAITRGVAYGNMFFDIETNVGYWFTNTIRMFLEYKFTSHLHSKTSDGKFLDEDQDYKDLDTKEGSKNITHIITLGVTKRF